MRQVGFLLREGAKAFIGSRLIRAACKSKGLRMALRTGGTKSGASSRRVEWRQFTGWAQLDA